MVIVFEAGGFVLIYELLLPQVIIVNETRQIMPAKINLLVKFMIYLFYPNERTGRRVAFPNSQAQSLSFIFIQLQKIS
jgi:hypothetical protein